MGSHKVPKRRDLQFILPIVISSLLLSVAIGETTSTQPTSAPQDTAVNLEPRAADEALQNLIDRAMELKLASGRTVSTLLARTSAGGEMFRQLILTHHRQSRPRRLNEDIVEVDAWLTLRNLAEILQTVVVKHSIQTDKDKLSLEAAGGQVIVATGRAFNDGRVYDQHVGWRHCEKKVIDLVGQAVEIDLCQNLLAHIAGFRSSDHRTVGQLFVSYPRFRQAVQRRVEAVVLGNPVFEPTGLCRLSVRLPRTAIIELLVRAGTESAQDIKADFSGFIDPSLQDPLIVEGFAVAPPAKRNDWLDFAGPRPTWIDQFLAVRAEGKVPTHIEDESKRRKLAATAARLEATRRLWLQIEGLRLPDGETVSERLARHPDAPNAACLIEQAIFPIDAPVFSDDGTALVTVGIQLQTVWHILRTPPVSK